MEDPNSIAYRGIKYILWISMTAAKTSTACYFSAGHSVSKHGLIESYDDCCDKYLNPDWAKEDGYTPDEIPKIFKPEYVDMALAAFNELELEEE